MGGTPQFQVPITAVDRFDAMFKRFEKRAGETFRETSKLGREAGEKLDKAFEPVSKLFGLGGFVGGVGLVGAAEGISRLAEAGAALGRTSARIGVSTDSLHQVGNAAYIAGGAADTGAKALENLGSKLHGAAWGRDAEAIAVFKEFGVAVRTTTGDIRKADEVLPEIAEKIKGLKDPYQQAMLAQALFGEAGRDLLPYLRDGADGIERYNAIVKKYSVESSKAFQDGSKAYEEAQKTMQLSARDFGAAIGRDLFPSLTTAMEKSTELLDRLQEMPGAMSAIEIGGGALVTLFGVTLVAAIGKFILAAGGIPGAVIAGVGAAGYAANEFTRRTTGQDLPFTGTPADIGIAASGMWNRVERWLGPNKPGAEGGPAGDWGAGPKQGTRVAPNDALNNWASIRGPGGWEHYGSAGEGVQAVDKLLRGGRSGRMYLGGGNNTLRGIISKWAPGSENDTALLISRAERMMGIAADTPIDPNDRETMRRLVTTMIANEHGGVLPPGLAQGTIDSALGFGGGNAKPGGVDPRLAAAMDFAISRLPEGHTAKLTAGMEGGHVAGSEHHDGTAGDYQIYGPGGAAIPNRGGASPLYRGMAVDALTYLMKNYPDAAKNFAWGGHFETSPGSGVSDDMHYGIKYGPRGRVGDIYSERTEAAARLAQEGSGPTFVPGAGDGGSKGGMDTAIHVQMDIRAPQGTRADVTRTDGPATFGLSLGKAMQGP